MTKSLFILLIIFVLVNASTLKIRSTWLDASQCPDEKTTRDVIVKMKENGLNRIYVGSWKNGKTFYKSETLFKAIGKEGIGRDIIPWAVKYGHEQKLEVYAWFEYGYIASYMNLSTPFGIYAKKKGWILGEVNHMHYMNPRSEATNFLANIMIDSVKYGLDGLQLDDHFSCRKKFSICNTGVILDAANKLRKLIRVKTKLPLSLAPAPLPLAMFEYSVDWPQLFHKGYFDEIVPLLYTSTYNGYEKMLKVNEGYMRQPLRNNSIMGIMVNKDGGGIVPWENVKKMINLTNQHNYGVTVWYGKSIVKDYYKEFHELWGRK